MEECRSWSLVKGASKYATINRIWQVAVKREMFSELRLDSARLLEADTILNGTPRRQKFVRTVRLYAKLPYAVYFVNHYKDDSFGLQATLETFLSVFGRWTPGPPIKLPIGAFETFAPTVMDQPRRGTQLAQANVVTEVDITLYLGLGRTIPPRRHL